MTSSGARGFKANGFPRPSSPSPLKAQPLDDFGVTDFAAAVKKKVLRVVRKQEVFVRSEPSNL